MTIPIQLNLWWLYWRWSLWNFIGTDIFQDFLIWCLQNANCFIAMGFFTCIIFLVHFLLQSRDKLDLELDFKRHWEEFRSSSSEKVTACNFSLFAGVPCFAIWLIVVVHFHIGLSENHDTNGFYFYMQEKETALNMTVDVFCRLVKQHANVAQLITMYEDNLLF